MKRKLYLSIVFTSALLVLFLLLMELSLRFQQRLGPFYDLEMKHLDLGVLDNTLNHIPSRGETTLVIEGKRVSRNTNEQGLVLSQRLLPGATRHLRVLFLGDSFMEGYGEEYSIPGLVLREWDFSGVLPNTSLTFYNGGHSSYAPSIFIPQIKQLLPGLTVDAVVIDIDETDLGDDYFRYRPLTKRNGKGEIEGVTRSPLNAYFLEGLDRARRHRFFITRALHKLFHSHFLVPRETARKQYYDQALILSIPSLPEKEARSQHAEALQYFRGNLEELAQTLRFFKIPQVLFLHHPHRGHLEGKWNPLVRDEVESMARRHGFSFYAADEALKRQDFSKLYFQGDMHFNLEGIKTYALLVSQALKRTLHRHPN